jgi:hypothetical protein
MVSQLDRAYADARDEEQQRSSTIRYIRLRPINWRDRVVKLAPVLPRPATGFAARARANFVWP